MKTLITLLTACAIVLLASCNKENNGHDPNSEEESSYRKLLVEQTLYNVGGDEKAYFLYILDSVNRTITCMMDSTRDFYEKSYFDVNGRLIKLVVNNWRDNVPTSKDSVMYSRPSASVVKREYDIGNGPYSETATTTDLGAGKKRIVLTNSESDPVEERLYLNAAGNPDSLVIVTTTGGNLYFVRTEMIYNGSGVPVSILRSNYEQGTNDVWTMQMDFTRDTRDNAELHSLINSLSGSDLGWVAYSSNTARTAFLSYHLTDKFMLLKGTVTSYTYAGNSGQASGTIYFPVQYDSKGRLTSWNEVENAVKRSEVKITYFD